MSEVFDHDFITDRSMQIVLQLYCCFKSEQLLLFKFRVVSKWSLSSG